MFGNSTEERAELLAELHKIQERIAELRREQRAEATTLSLTEKVNELRKQISQLEIDKAKITETNARERREVEHMVGLQKQRQEVEHAQAVREAQLVVREENLAADKSRVEEQVEFLQTRFESEVGYLKDIMESVLARLPEVQVSGELPAARTPSRPRKTTAARR